MLQNAEGGVKQGVEFVRTTTADKVLPAIRARVPTARGCFPLPNRNTFLVLSVWVGQASRKLPGHAGVIEERLRLNSELGGSSEALLQLATATRVTARRMRFALAAADLLGRARAVSTFLSSRALYS